MKVAIVGAGSVGRSIARELLGNQHDVLLIDKSVSDERRESLPGADWLVGDACEISVLAEAGLEEFEVVVAATGDDKVNLVFSLLAKTEYGVPRTVARVSNPKNEWMFDDSWGVDVAVSTPRIMTALVEEAVTIGALVRIFTFNSTESNMVELKLPGSSPVIGSMVGSIQWPHDTVLVGVIRDGRPIPPTSNDVLEAGDELLLIAASTQEPALQDLLAPMPEEHASDHPWADASTDASNIKMARSSAVEDQFGLESSASESD